MDREDFLLSVLSAYPGAEYSPLQVQKLLFLADKNVGTRVGGPFFTFIPYHYGPFDSSLYGTLYDLSSRDLIEIRDEPGRLWSRYKLTPTGSALGQEKIEGLDESQRSYLTDLGRFVATSTFSQLLSAVYKAHPDMAVNSIVRSRL